MFLVATGIPILGTAIFASVTFSSWVALSATALGQQGSPDQVIVTVHGAGCPFCVFGLEKWFGNIEGVQDVEMELETGRATLTLQPGASVSEEELRRAVEKAGFTPGETIQDIQYQRSLQGANNG